MAEYHYFYMSSSDYGTERFGPYDTEEEAFEGMEHVQRKAYELKDGVRRSYWVSTNPNEEYV